MAIGMQLEPADVTGSRWVTHQSQSSGFYRVDLESIMGFTGYALMYLLYSILT